MSICKANPLIWLKSFQEGVFLESCQKKETGRGYGGVEKERKEYKINKMHNLNRLLAKSIQILRQEGKLGKISKQKTLSKRLLLRL